MFTYTVDEERQRYLELLDGKLLLAPPRAELPEVVARLWVKHPNQRSEAAQRRAAWRSSQRVRFVSMRIRSRPCRIHPRAVNDNSSRRCGGRRCGDRADAVAFIGSAIACDKQARHASTADRA